MADKGLEGKVAIVTSASRNLGGAFSEMMGTEGASVAEQWGRRWITIDTSRVALALARMRLMAAKYPYYLLADSPEGIQKEAELTGKLPPPQWASHHAILFLQRRRN